MKKLLTLLLLLPATAAAQQQRIVSGGMVLDGGEVRTPTPALAMKALLEPSTQHQRPHAPAVAVLRQRYELRSAVELDAMVENLVRLVLGSDRDASLRAQLALMGAGQEAGHGTRHPGAISGLIRAYETARASEHHANPNLILATVFYAGEEGYVVELLETSERPAPCVPSGDADTTNPCPNRSSWCDAAMVLHDRRHEAAPPAGVVDRLCGWGRWILG
ncbi:MAG: hypothetical protein OXL34_17390 [Gemmatimonadota bacterium]|nr:hypothetical protein [Gemmatimonadota bacterium]